MEKNSTRGVVERIIQASPRAVFISRSFTSAIFLRTVRAWQCLNWFKVFLVVLVMAFI